ncbi:MAG: hypothetical protein ABFS17_09575 [Chloroflexota bacterium]
MKSIPIISTILILFFSLSSINEAGVSHQNNQAADPTPVPTYDPLAEPFLPENPTELEYGQNWYWHNCMTCHGDLGQGLTDEFRGIWPEDHQNCWAHGCHGGKLDDEGFPIPTSVPALVRADKLSKFSQESIYIYLKSTHPPQTPGVLENKQYIAIVKYLFAMNDRPLEAVQAPTETPKPAPSPTAAPPPAVQPQPEPDQPWLIGGGISIGIIFVLIFMWRLKSRNAGA